MLKKLAGFVFWETYAITLFLRDIPEIGAAFKSIEAYGSLGTVLGTIPHATSLNITGFVLAFLVALVTHVAQLHDRISDILRIRARFDRDKILVPLSKLVQVSLSEAQLRTLREKRDTLMREVFYRYASSRAEVPLVDKHDIEHALAAWSWFWVLIEAAVLFVVASFVAFIFNAPGICRWFFVVVFVCVVLAFIQHRRLGRHAQAEIEAIAANADASRHVRETFNAL